MKKKGIGIISLILIIIIAIVAGIKIKQNHDENAVQEIQPVKVSSKTVPTFFFHGWGSSWHAEDTMAQAIKRAGATNTIVRVNVNKKGHARLICKIKKNAKNPLVEVNFSDNKLTNSQYNGQYANAYDSTGARYVKNAIDLVRNKYHYSKINIVAHSMGNLEVASYIKLNAGKKNFPQIDHLVAMAGHYDGIIGMNDKRHQLKIDKKTGKPSIMRPEYRNLLSLRKIFPKNTKVLNIYGNLEDGTNSDGDVSNASAQSLKYLINGRAKSYRQLMIRGKGGQHSKLYNNAQVNRALVNFLWK
ncbi:alpha/beta hydrolase [Lactobacillus kefiranofaciens]|uniref:alpha/beta hydrolase n=2 Tax=Lactobacillus kefiranofaciens TaxID=267818 RepID=UPI00166714B2|nr:alpha/beta hydrolase [Lactobacillus kefiranofaciens]MCJ2172993.1 alpha/beta hydrolase [Lactobacillus kefiranofaciens]MDF4142651.1 alpha/beta hydrolase [Lactobacillus kefiranofaciens]QNT43908.1 alpha/beta hydrolase [Lactobacillus kefiranofaciens]